jgi:ribonucleoside-triphosphate reductase
MMEVAALAHVRKREFLSEMLSLGSKGPLAVLCVDHDGETYIRLNKSSHLIGLIGLEEMVHCVTGKRMHEDREAMDLGLAVTRYMDLKCRELTERLGLKIVLEQTPAESTAYRLARLDLKFFPDQASMFVKGDPDRGEVYYTNSTHFAYDADLDPATRVFEEGRFHPMINAGAITHVWMGERRPDPGALASFVKKVFEGTASAQIAFSPEFTICNDCGRVDRGLLDVCPVCGSSDVDGITRITGYFTRTSSWNPGKRGELRDRKRVGIG